MCLSVSQCTQPQKLLTLYQSIGKTCAPRKRKLLSCQRSLDYRNYALRAALVLAGPAPSVLNESSVRLTPGSLVVSMPKQQQALIAEAMTKRLETLALSFGRTLKFDLK